MFPMFLASALTLATGPFDFMITCTTVFLSLALGFDMDVLRLHVFANNA